MNTFFVVFNVFWAVFKDVFFKRCFLRVIKQVCVFVFSIVYYLAFLSVPSFGVLTHKRKSETPSETQSRLVPELLWACESLRGFAPKLKNHTSWKGLLTGIMFKHLLLGGNKQSNRLFSKKHRLQEELHRGRSFKTTEESRRIRSHMAMGQNPSTLVIPKACKIDYLIFPKEVPYVGRNPSQ